MSTTLSRQQRRANEREAMRNLKVLGDHLGEFYSLLERKPKPSDQEVREAFIKHENAWKGYCRAHKLTEEAALMFNREVAVSWKNRYARNNDPESSTKK